MKRFFLYFTEIIIWLVAIYFIVQVSILMFYPQVKEYKEYTVKMSDIDGLIVGSPVRLMGMQVGTVSDIKYDEDRILLTIRVTKKGINLPSRTTLAIEGASLGGNRSIELIPNGDEEGISVKNPQRMVNMIKSANAAIEDMIKGYVSMLEIVNTRTPDELQKKISFFNNQLIEYDTLSQRINEGLLDSLKKHPKQLHSIRDNMDTMVKSSSNPQIKENIRNIDSCIDSIQHQTRCMCEQTKKIDSQKIYNRCEDINQQSRISGKIKKKKAKTILTGLNAAADGINSFANMINNFTSGIKDKKKKKQN